MKRIVPALVAALLLTPAVVPAQSLGEAAARDKEKKEKDKSRKPAKAYTEEDLRGKLNGTMSNPGSTASPTGSSTGDATAASPAPADAPETAEEQEAALKNWRARRDHVQSEITRINAALASFEARLADNTQPMYGPGRDALVKNVERSKADLVRAQADLATIETEGRSKSFN